MALQQSTSYSARINANGSSDRSPTSSSLLSSSISSLGPSSSRRAHKSASSHVSKTYRQASQLFLTRRLPEALSTLEPLVVPVLPDHAGASNQVEPAPIATASRSTRVKVWSLYLTILNAIVELEAEDGKDAFGAQEWRTTCAKVREGQVWEDVVRNGYHGVEGNVDAEVVINLATLLLAHARNQSLNQKRLEAYLAAATSPNLDLTGRFPTGSPTRSRSRQRSMSKSKSALRSGAATPRDLNARVKILEIYTLHVLLRNNEWDYARDFISESSVLDEERREAFLQALQTLQEEHFETQKKEDEERQRQEEELQQEVDRVRREKEKSEDEERRGRERDYGVDGAPNSKHKDKEQQKKDSKRRGAAEKSSKRGHNSSKRNKNTNDSASSSGPPASRGVGIKLAAAFGQLRTLIQRLGGVLRTSDPAVLLRTLAFVATLLLVLGRREMRERVRRVLGAGWGKIMSTAGMGVKVSYI